MYRFKKRPITIHARQLRQAMTVETLEGTMKGEIGSWLIEGIHGEFYFCQDDVFRKTYDPADAHSEQYLNPKKLEEVKKECQDSQ